MIYLLDYLFTIVHLAFVFFILFGWVNPRTRKAHVTALLLTLLSWLLLGLYTGTLGYCLLTDWHWDLKRALGETGMSSSFIEYIIERLTGINFSRTFIDTMTAMGLLFGGVMAAVYNKRGHRNEKEHVKSKEKRHHMA